MDNNFTMGKEDFNDNAPETTIETPDKSQNEEGKDIDMVVESLEGETGKEAMETLAHLSDNNEKNDELKTTNIEHLDKDSIVDFDTMNIIARILKEAPVKKSDFGYEKDNSEKRGNEIEAAMDADVDSLIIKNQDGNFKEGVSDEALHSLLSSEIISDHAKIFVLIYIQTKNSLDFSSMTVEDLSNVDLKVRVEGYEKKAHEILSHYKKKKKEKNESNNIEDSTEEDETISGIDTNEKMEQIDLKTLVEDIDMKDYLDVETSELKLKEELSKDFKELIKRFSKESKIRQLENYLDKLTSEKQERLLDFYRIALEKYQEEVLDKIMDLSTVEEINKNFQFVLENVKVILKNEKEK